MFYQQSEALLAENLEFASEEAIEKLDAFLAGLPEKQALQISPWRVCNKTGLSKEAVIEVFLKLAQKGLLRIKYEVWHPQSRVKIFETFNVDDLKNSIDPQHEGDEPFVPDDDDIQLSFVLNHVKTDESSKKKVRIQPHRSDQFSAAANYPF